MGPLPMMAMKDIGWNLYSSGMSSDSQKLSGQVAVVTGGSRGIGLAIAGALLSAGANVVITGRDRSHLDLAAKKLSEGGRADRLLASRADVSDAGEAAGAISAAIEKFGGLDILINNAAVGVFASVEEMDPAGWHQVIQTNLSGVFFCCHAAIPAMRKRGGGWIINISSLAGTNPFTGGAAYCASKAGLNAFSESLMKEVRYDDIRVSCVMPGSVATGFNGVAASAQDDWKLAPEDVAEVVMDLIAQPPRSLPSRVEIRPTKPRK
jgi:NAD(P)-dependent dehydrogenase (short-subunit alcohol dehydrogenase family)